MLLQERLKEILRYIPETGKFVWKISRSGIRGVGSVAGCFDNKGYIIITVDRKPYKAHRLAWLYTYGYLPENQIDHLNGICSDNRIENLREVSVACNMQNTKTYSHNTSGFPGVSCNKRDQQWYAAIRIQGKSYYLGCYKTSLDAALARYTAEVQCPKWTCNHRSELVMAIKKAWPKFHQGVYNE